MIVLYVLIQIRYWAHCIHTSAVIRSEMHAFGNSRCIVTVFQVLLISIFV